MPTTSVAQLMRVFLEQIEKSAQVTTDEDKPQVPTVKYNRAIKANISDINMAISDLNSAKSLVTPNQSAAIACITKLVNYLTWYRTIGIGGNVSAQGKDDLIPSVEEIKSLIKTKLFGENFIISLASLLKMNDAIPQFKNELANV